MYYSDAKYNPYSNNDQNSAEAISQNAVAKGLFTKAIGLEAAEGNLHGFVQACTAIELYDGSYILHSNPVLLGQSLDAYTRYEDGGYNYLTNKVIHLDNSLVQSNYDGRITPLGFTNDTDKKRWIGKSTQSRALADTVVLHDAPNLYVQNIVGIGVGASSYMYCTVSANDLQFKINADIPLIFKPLIKSVAIFITHEISLYKTETSKYVGSATLPQHTDDWTSVYNWQPEIKTNAELLTELSENQRFYKVHEITFDELRTLSPGTWIDINLKDKIGDNLVNQEALPVDNFTHHSYKPNKQLVYNSKLHIMDYQQELFRPWPVNYFYQTFGKGQFSNSAQEGTVDAQGWIEYATVNIKTETGISTTVRITPETQGSWLNIFNLLPIISYPDSRATAITIYRNYYDAVEGRYFEQQKTFPLKASESQNYAYYIDPDMKPIAFTEGIFTDEPTGIVAETDRTLIYRNAMKVSSVNNPFYFPAETTYTIGTGTILNAGTNAQRMSEGQFGQYDLYVLTTEGMYSLDTGTEISYNRQSPASLEIPISDILCSMPYGVLFIGKRGLYMITGQETQFISAQIEENGATNSIVAEGTSFSTFVQNLKDILYDNRENEIILVSNTLDYNYVYNIDSKMWYISTEKIDYEIKNSSPNLLVSEGKKIKDYSQQETDKAAVSIITRPLFFGIDEVKKLERSYLRGKFYSLTSLSPFYSIYGSNDGVQQLLLRGFTIPATKQNRTYKDFDSGIIARSTYRNYTIAFEATVGEQTEISHVDFEVTDNYSNDKLR